jgi:hypothetical protein
MIETAWMLVRLLAGLGSIEAAGYALFILVLRRRSGFKPLERLSLAFGLGSLGLTIWMLLLSYARVPYSLATVAFPWFALAALGVWPAWKRGWLQEDCRAALAVGQSLLTRGGSRHFTRLEKVLLLLLVLAFGFSFLRATLYPLWAWDALSTW